MRNVSGRSAQILIVDDESHNRKLLELLLGSDGYQTRSANNGEDALASISQGAPDLILLDIMMPGMDGFQVAGILKAAPATANIPIIMVTALIDQASRLAGLNAGVEEFLTKPVDRAELSIRVRNLLRLKTMADLLRDHNLVLEQQVRMRTAELQRFRTAMDASSDAILLVNCTTLRFEEFNATACRMLGYTRAELFQAGPLHIAQMTHEKLNEEYQALIAGRGANEASEIDLLCADGSVRPGEVHRHPQLHGSDWIMVETVRDITERKAAQREQEKLSQQLRDQHFYTRSLIESNIDALMTTDPFGIVTDVNRQMEALTGLTRDELIGTPSKSYFTHPAKAEGAIKRVLAEGTIHNYELTIRARDGRLTVVSYNATTFNDRQRKLCGVVAAARDITERKQYEETLRNATHQAEQASRAKTEFLANMSHEIRTPMSAVVGLADLLGKTSLSEEQADTLGKVKIASNALLVLLNNVLDLSKIEAGELIVENAPFDLRALLQKQSGVFAEQARAKGIAFTIDAAEDLPARLEGDANRLAQILSILLSNAVKFTDHGAVTFCVHNSAATAQRVTLRFVVTDTGIGIGADVQAGLFEPFVQGDGSTTRRHGGTGLGLSIVRGLASLMGGSVSLSSTPGAGSEFTLMLDFAPAAEATPASSEELDRETGAGALRGLNALVVDDSDINLVLMKRLLEMHGATAELTGNGLEAFERLQARPHDFQVVLMDVQMPVLDGYAATQRIRKELKLTELPIIAVTAGALSSHRRRADEAGMSDYVVKPFDSSTLVRTILRHVKPARVTGQGSAAPMARPQTAAPWPEIEGIASAEVRARLSGDFALFRSLLTRLLDEFSDVAICGTPQDADSLAICRARLHKLKGSAGMLGANAIQKLAGEGEAAFASGDIARAAPMATRIAIQLQRLREHALPAFLTGPD